MKTVTMPQELTAENGAKALLMGEFYERITRNCPECGGDEDKCIACGGSGVVTEFIHVSIKRVS